MEKANLIFDNPKSYSMKNNIIHQNSSDFELKSEFQNCLTTTETQIEIKVEAISKTDGLKACEESEIENQSDNEELDIDFGAEKEDQNDLELHEMTPASKKIRVQSENSAEEILDLSSKIHLERSNVNDDRDDLTCKFCLKSFRHRHTLVFHERRIHASEKLDIPSENTKGQLISGCLLSVIDFTKNQQTI